MNNLEHADENELGKTIIHHWGSHLSEVKRHFLSEGVVEAKIGEQKNVNAHSLIWRLDRLLINIRLPYV